MVAGARAGLSKNLPAPQWFAPQTGPAAGMKLAFWAYPAAGKPWAHVLISHGFSEHSGWWQHAALAFQARGISAYLFDHYHHGVSAGRVADARSYDELAAGLKVALEQGVLPRVKGEPVVLFGHSNGGLVSLWGLREVAPHLKGLVLCSPLIQMPWVSKWVGLLPAWTLSRVNPEGYWHIPLQPNRLTSDARVWPEYLSDPLRFHKISPQFFLAMRAASNAIQDRTDVHNLPLLLLSADEDKVVDRAAMLRWFARAESPDKTRLPHRHREHELFNEADWQNTAAEVVSWMEQRFAGR